MQSALAWLPWTPLAKRPPTREIILDELSGTRTFIIIEHHRDRPACRRVSPGCLRPELYSFLYSGSSCSWIIEWVLVYPSISGSNWLSVTYIFGDMPSRQVLWRLGPHFMVGLSIKRAKRAENSFVTGIECCSSPTVWRLGGGESVFVLHGGLLQLTKTIWFVSFHRLFLLLFSCSVNIAGK